MNIRNGWHRVLGTVQQTVKKAAPPRAARRAVDRDIAALLPSAVRAVTPVVLLWMAVYAPMAFGFGVNQCAASRAGSSLNCTANDVSIASVTVTNGVVECTAGQMVTLNLSLNVQSNASTRYDIGVFLASDGKDPSVLPGSGGSTSCNVSALPTTPPFLNSNSNGCGDISSSVGLAAFTMNSINVVCQPDALGKLRIDSVVTWQQNSSGTPTCSGANDVTAGGPSKCSTGIAAEINVNVKGGLTVIKKTSPSGSPQLFAFSASGASASPTSFNLSDGGQQVISTGNLTTTPQSLQVVESATPGWVPTAINCIDGNGNPNPAYVTTNPATGTITANLSIANPSATCTVTNTQSPSLTLVKQVVNSNGGAATAGQWTLQAAGPKTISGASGSAAVTGATVPAGTYTLSESGGPAGYSASAWTCTNSVAVTNSQITLGNGASTTCTITNSDQPATLTLVKHVANTNGGVAAASNWTLQAAGPTTISGVSGTAAVTAAAVSAGTYALSESGGPAGYSASVWTCTNNVTVSGGQITLGNGVSTTCTIINSDQAASLTLVKHVVNNNGGTAAATNWTLHAAGPTSISGTTGAAAVTAAAVPAGTYTLSESGGPTGYSASAWSCTNNVGVSGGQITLGNGVSTTCTVTNSDQPAVLTLVKQVVNTNGGTAVATNWTLQAAGPTTISGATGASAVTAAAVSAGTYALSESGGPTGYTASAWSCTNNVVVTGGQITLGNGVSTTCAITNSDQPATLTLIKQVVNTNGGVATAGNWTLLATGPTTISGTTGATAVTSAAVSAGSYTLSESGGPAGYTASVWACTNNVAVTGGQITLGNGVSTACTITNSDQAATLTLVKQVVNTNGGTAIATNWTLQAAGPATISGATGAAAVTAAAVPAGTYALSESGGPAGYSASVWTCTNNVAVTGGQITLGNGVNTTCTITNSDQAATLTLVKQVVNTNGGLAVAANWTLQAAGPATISGATGASAVTAAAVPAGTYALSESGGPAGYSASAWSCTNNVAVTGGQITLGNGVSTTCTITNSDQAAILTLTKQVVNTNGGVATASNWTLHAAGPTTISGTTGTSAVTAIAVSAGAYTLSESGGPAGYTASAWACTNNVAVSNGQITLGNGISTICTITNSDQPAVLTLVKQVVNTNGGLATASNWTLQAAGPTTISGATGAAAVTSAPVPAGTYTLSESGGPAGYAASVWTCTNNVSVNDGQITLGNGVSTTCTITNNDLAATLTLVKQVVNNNGGTATATNWTLQAAGPTTISGTVGAAAITSAAVPAGTYTLSESGGPAGYSASAWTCTNNVVVTNGQITLGNGTSTTCTITNSDLAATLTLIKQVVNNHGGTAAATHWTLQAAGPTTISGANGAAAVTAAAVLAGTYTLSESGGPTGYSASVWSCTNNVTVTNGQITLGNGVSTACTIINSDQTATLTLVKQVVNTNGGTAIAVNWMLQAAGPTTISGATGSLAVSAAAVSAGTYTLSESGGPTGYIASAWTCTNNVTVTNAQITLGNGENTTCTITNSDQAAILTLIKQVVNTNGGSAAANEWMLQAAGPKTISGTTGTAAVTAAAVPAGTYALSESGGPTGYTASAWTCANNIAVTNGQITLGNGVNTTCTIINSDQAATLTLVKQVVNTNGGAATASQWTLHAIGPATVGGSTGAAAITAAAVPAGTYTLSESGGPAGYAASAWTCTNNVVVNNGQITLGNGASTTCTITNSDQPATLTLVKQAVNTHGGSAAAEAWMLQAAGPTTISGMTGSTAVTAATVAAGTYALSEMGGPSGYTASAWTCTNDVAVSSGQITLSNGASTTCTITNSDQPATITLIIQVTNTNGGTATAGDWTAQAAGPTTISGATGSTTVTIVPVPAGTYTLSGSSGPPGYTAGTWTCTNGVIVTNGQISLGSGVTTVCTLVYSDQPATLTLVKHVANVKGGKAIPTSWTLRATGPITVSGATGSAAVTAAALPVGTYALSESDGPPGYAASAWTCTNGVTVSESQIHLSNGTSTTCTITNSDTLALPGPVSGGELVPTPMLPAWALVLLGLIVLGFGAATLRRYHR